jgi:hypothetical protein
MRSHISKVPDRRLATAQCHRRGVVPESTGVKLDCLSPPDITGVGHAHSHVQLFARDCWLTDLPYCDIEKRRIESTAGTLTDRVVAHPDTVSRAPALPRCRVERCPPVPSNMEDNGEAELDGSETSQSDAGQ